MPVQTDTLNPHMFGKVVSELRGKLAQDKAKQAPAQQVIDTASLEVKTSDGKMWKYHAPKSGGANESGTHGGVYKNAHSGEKCLVKKENNVAKNIAEFLGSAIFQAVHLESSARVELVNPKNSRLPNEDGQDVYVASIFIKNYKCDLFKDILGDKAPDERPKLLGMVFKKPIEKAFRDKGYQDFEKVAVTSLLIGDFDIHTGNIGVVVEGAVKKLVRIDFAAAFEKLESEVHPNSDSRHLPGMGPTNRFKDYAESIKLNAKFVAELDMIGKKDFTATLDKAFTKIGEFYGVDALHQFAEHIGMDVSYLSAEKDKALAQIKSFVASRLQEREKDLARFSAQIKTDLCIQNENGGWKLGSYIDKSGKEILFEEVVREHQDYFIEVFNGEKPFKFRMAHHKNAKDELIEKVRDKAAYVIASQIMNGTIKVGKSAFPNNNFDAIYEALRSGSVHLKDIIGNDPKIALNRQGHGSLCKLANANQLDKAHAAEIKRLIVCGSNPNLTLPDGSKVIDKCSDFETKKLLVEHGAHVTKNSLKDCTSDQQKALKECEKEFKSKGSKTELNKALCDAIAKGDLEVVKGIARINPDTLRNGVMIGSEKYSVLDYALLHKNNEALKVLVKVVADVNVMHSKGTGLHSAVLNGDCEAVRILLGNKANPHLKHHGITPAELVEKSNNTKMKEIFAEHKALKHTSQVENKSSRNTVLAF